MKQDEAEALTNSGSECGVEDGGQVLGMHEEETAIMEGQYVIGVTKCKTNKRWTRTLEASAISRVPVSRV